MIDFTRNLTLAQISFGVMIIAVSLFWLAFVKDSGIFKGTKSK